MFGFVFKVVRWAVKSAAWCSVLLLVVEGHPNPTFSKLAQTAHDRIPDVVGDRKRVLQLPLERRVRGMSDRRRDGEAGTRAIGLGDSQDVYVRVSLPLDYG